MAVKSWGRDSKRDYNEVVLKGDCYFGIGNREAGVNVGCK